MYGRRSGAERRAERRERLLAAALDTFASQGFRAASIEQLCATAKVSTRGFYEEFDGKEAVLASLHDQLNERALVAVGDAVSAVAVDDLERRATAGCAAY